MSMKDIQGYIVNNNCTTIIVVIKLILLMTFGFFFLLTLIVNDLDWHVHQKDNHETTQLSMKCKRGWKTA
jgi:hypothetical protein